VSLVKHNKIPKFFRDLANLDSEDKRSNPQMANDLDMDILDFLRELTLFLKPI
jgi:hypothetical protein